MVKTNKSFLYLMLGQSVSNIGDVLYTVGVITIIYHLTGSAAASALVPFTITFSMSISSILTPLMIGKFSLKHLLVGSQIGKTVLLFGLGVLLQAGIVSSHLFILFLFIGCIALLDGCANPIRQTLIPYYVEEKLLVKANGLAETITQTIQIGTWFLGSLLLIAVSPTQLIWLVSFLFVVSSFQLSRMDHVVHEESKDQIWSQLTKGWRTIRNTSVLKAVVKMEFFESIAGSVWIASILLVFVEQILKTEEYWWGFINSAYFIGMVIGSTACIRFSWLVDQNRHRFIIAGAVLSCICTFWFGLTNLSVIAVLMSACIGLFGQLKNIPQQTLIQTSVQKNELATVYTSIGTIATGVFGIASLSMGILADMFGIRIVFLLSGFLLVLVTLIAVWNRDLFWKREVRHS